jgi:hypothetical protein
MNKFRLIGFSLCLLPFQFFTNSAQAQSIASSEKLTVEKSQIPYSSDAPIVSDTSDESLSQVTSVSQLSDVQPTDWAYQAVQSLVERYGCIAGYPDGTFKGSRAASRYELAAALNACLDQISDKFADKEDLTAVKALQEEFKAELATLKGRIDSLEARTSTLEAQQFSTTTRLGGEVIFGLAGAVGGTPPGKGKQNVVLGHLTRLQVATSFTGKDVLRLQLAASNFSDRGFANPDALNTNMALTSFQSDSGNQFRLDALEYRFAPLDKLVVTIQPVGFSLTSVLTANSPYFDIGRGSISRFGEASPIFKIGNLDAGMGLDWLITNKLRLQVAYGTRNAAQSTINGFFDQFGNPITIKGGLTGSDHSALGIQLLFKPTNRILTGFTYINAYSSNGNLDTFTGSSRADTSGGINEPSQIHAVNATFQWRATNHINIGASIGASYTTSLASNSSAVSGTYQASLGYSDPFDRQGDLAAIIFGQPPKLYGGENVPSDQGTSLHTELLYRFKINDNISVTPGFFVVTEPGHVAGNNPIFVGVLRTTFRF